MESISLKFSQQWPDVNSEGFHWPCSVTNLPDFIAPFSTNNPWNFPFFRQIIGDETFFWFQETSRVCKPDSAWGDSLVSTSCRLTFLPCWLWSSPGSHSGLMWRRYQPESPWASPPCWQWQRSLAGPDSLFPGWDFFLKLRVCVCKFYCFQMNQGMLSPLPFFTTRITIDHPLNREIIFWYCHFSGSLSGQNEWRGIGQGLG